MTNQEIWDEAIKAGKEAANQINVRPMVVEEHQDQLNDFSPIVKQWFVEDGVCGFASVHLKPATTPFAKWLKENGLMKKDTYRGGLYYWVGEYNQCMQRKEAHAEAMSRVLNNHGYHTWAESRLD